jgi:serine/threonine-protein kinase HipA
LAPAFDVLPTNSGQGHQEFLVGLDGRDSTLANAMSQCELFGLNATQAVGEISQVIAVVDTWQGHFEACGVSQSDRESLAERIDGAPLREQRLNFTANDYLPQKSAVKKPLRRPF